MRLGLTAFVDNAAERCRLIAARLVDRKAAALASRMDEMPARLLALPNEERPEAAIRELGKLVLLAKAWRARPDAPEIRRLVATSETRDEVIAADLTIEGSWEVLGERIQTRRDGLVSHAAWLMRMGQDAKFALLLDFYPASAGKRSSSYTPGEQFEATLAFYPSPAPLRALILKRSDLPTPLPWSPSPLSSDPLAACAPCWNAAPWELEWPVLLPAGRIARDARGHCWWRTTEHSTGLPLTREVPLPVLGMPLSGAAGLWNGVRLDLLAAQSTHGYGRIDLS